MTFHKAKERSIYLNTLKVCFVSDIVQISIMTHCYDYWYSLQVSRIISCYHVEWQYRAIGSGPDASEVLVFLRHLPGDLVELHLVVSLPHADNDGDGADNVWWSHSNPGEHNIVSLLSAQNSAAAHTVHRVRPAGWAQHY